MEPFLTANIHLIDKCARTDTTSGNQIYNKCVLEVYKKHNLFFVNDVYEL